MARKSRPTRRRRTPRATDGGSRIALSAILGRPGGTHGRRKPNKKAIRRKAINESKENS